MYRVATIDNFRAIRHLKLQPLGQFNLIVGANGCGKTSLLEALWLNSMSFEMTSVRYVAIEHDLGTPDPNSELIMYTPKDFCHRATHTQPEKFTIELGDRLMTVDYSDSDSSAAKAYQFNSSKTGNLDQSLFRRQMNGLVRIYPSNGLISPESLEHFTDLTLEWLKLDAIMAVPHILYSKELPQRIPSIYLPSTKTMGLEPDRFWGIAVQKGGDEMIEDALRTVIPDLRRINFASRSRGDRFQSIPMAKLSNGEVMPLKALGEGVVRAFHLALAAVASQNGLLLVDELEIGLHHTVQEKLLRLLFRVIEKFNVQAVVTTHSRDTLEAATEAHKKLPNQLDLKFFRLECLENGSHHAFALGAPELEAAALYDVEVR